MERIVSGALDEVAALGWRHVTMEAVARRAGLKLGEVLIHVPTKSHLVARIADHIDAATFARVDLPDPASSPRDRLFDIVMRRFDVLQKHRDGFKALVAGAARDPGLAAMSLARLSRSMAAILAGAGISADGLIGCARVQAMKAVYLSTLKAWMDDDSADMSKTMAALDKALGIAERAASMTPLRRRGEKKAA